MGEKLQVPGEPTAVEGYLAWPAGTVRGAVAILPARYGLEEGYCDLADRLAAEGYGAFAFDWQQREPDAPTAVSLRDLRSARAFLAARTDRPLGLIGFCRGGTLVYWAMSEDPSWRAGIALYSLPKGTAGKDPPGLSLQDQPSPEGTLLIMHGGRDPVVPMEEIVEYARWLGSQGTPYELKVYSEMGHRFFLPSDAGHDPEAAGDAWNEMKSFLGRKMPAA